MTTTTEFDKLTSEATVRCCGFVGAFTRMLQNKISQKKLKERRHNRVPKVQENQWSSKD